MYKRILVPLDGSGLAEKALSHAKTMATACGPSELDLMFVVEPLGKSVVEAYADEDKEYFSQSDKKAQAWGNNYLKKVSQSLKKDSITSKTFVLVGKPADTILDFAAENSIDLIIMSSHGRSGFNRWAFGSVAEKVLKTSKSPVLIFKPNE